MSNNSEPESYSNRRRLLKAAGAACVGLTAGCSGQQSSGGQPANDDTSTASSKKTNQGGGQLQLPSEIEWVIYTSPGGGFDSYSRALAPILEEKLSEYGVERIRPNNRTGAGGRIALNHIWNAEPDGSVIGIWNHPGHIIAQLTEDTQYDLQKMTHVGQVAQSPRGIAVPKDSDITSYEGLVEKSKQQKLKVGTTGEGAGSWVADKILIGVDDINAKVVTGYDGASEYVTATIRDDLDFAQTTVGTLNNLMVQPDKGSPLLVLSSERDPRWPDTPTRVELGMEPAVHGAVNLNRIVSGPPGMSDEVANVMSEAMMEALQSSQMKEWAKNNDRPLSPLSREKIPQLVQDGFDVLNRFKDLFQE